MKIFRIPLALTLVVLAGRTFPANAQSETTLYSFGISTNDGAQPYGALVQGRDGNFYGTTSIGGSNNVGIVFQITPGGAYTNLYTFGGFLADGQEPTATLVQGVDSNFYGTTYYGGTSGNCEYGCGTVFRISPSGTYTSLYSFVGPPTDGQSPFAGLVQGSDSNFYGTTQLGGTADSGTVFRISPSGSYTNLHSFAVSPNDGNEPDAGLMQGSDGNFYGTTLYGGTAGSGTVFRISASGTYTTLYSFAGSVNDGGYPEAALVQGSDSNFYGTTYGGGEKDFGILFRITPDGSFTNLHSFIGSPTDGESPYAALIQGIDSNFYGTTVYGGKKRAGTTFRISPSGAYVSLSSFGSSATDGVQPLDSLVQGSDSNFYGTAYGGGAYGGGTVFKLSIGGGGGCTYALNATSVTLAAKGGSKNVSVKVKGAGCAWTAVSNDPFITITAGANGTASGKVVYSVPGNTNTTPLTGTMMIAGQLFTVNQAAGGCTFSLSPKDGKLKATGGSATVKVKANLSDCDWTAVSNNSFITITGGTNGVGSGTVTYTVPANASTNILTGTMTIAGETFTVTQSGVK